MKFQLESPFKPAGDQKRAINEIMEKFLHNQNEVVLLGATATGKTFTVANIIQKIQKPTFVFCHNKTLAGQLYAEFKSFFPNNRVEYFVSNFDFYQPEAYMPKTDTYIDKTATSNSEIEMMRLSAMNALVSRPDTIVVCSVASIYGTFDPKKYKSMFFELKVDQKISRKELLAALVKRGYRRNDYDWEPGSFKVRGDLIEIAPGWTNSYYIRISLFGDYVEDIAKIDTLTSTVQNKYSTFTIFPADDYVSERENTLRAVENIKKELKTRLDFFKKSNKLLEAERLRQRVNHDCESLEEFNSVSGIENYSLHLDGRKLGKSPFTLIDYFGDDFLTIIDESHMSLPQVRGMFNADRSRKTTLVEHGFRLPSALDNRPLNFEEFKNKLKKIIYVSATPGDYEMEIVNKKPVEQIIRPTGLIDPTIEVLPSENQIDTIVENLRKAVKKGEKSFIIALTIKTSEELADYLKNYGFKIAYLHNELKTFERLHILNDLRKGKIDCVVGINLLREGLDLPEVALIMIIAADQMGFLRNTRSLIQIIGRAARNINGRILMFANNISRAMQEAIEETDRRRDIQIAFNKKNNIIPKTIVKEIYDPVEGVKKDPIMEDYLKTHRFKSSQSKEKILRVLKKQMLQSAKDLEFEKAAQIRDMIVEIRNG